MLLGHQLKVFFLYCLYFFFLVQSFLLYIGLIQRYSRKGKKKKKFTIQKSNITEIYFIQSKREGKRVKHHMQYMHIELQRLSLANWNVSVIWISSYFSRFTSKLLSISKLKLVLYRKFALNLSRYCCLHFANLNEERYSGCIGFVQCDCIYGWNPTTNFDYH